MKKIVQTIEKKNQKNINEPLTSKEIMFFNVALLRKFVSVINSLTDLNKITLDKSNFSH